MKYLVAAAEMGINKTVSILGDEAIRLYSQQVFCRLEGPDADFKQANRGQCR